MLKYIPGLIEAYRAGHASDHVHLGYWEPGARQSWAEAQDAMAIMHLDAILPADGGTIADIGCGLGGSLRMLNARVDAARLVGINIDPAQLEICRTHRSSGANEYIWIEADAGQVPLSPDSADGLLSLEAMFHFRSRKGFLAEAARLLRPGGRMVCSDIVFDQPPDDQSAEWLDVVLGEYTPWPEPVTTCTQIVAEGEGVGLQLTEARDITRAVAPSWDCISRVDDSPLRSPVAAMRALQKSGFLHYVVMTFTKPRETEAEGKTQPVDPAERLGN